MKRFDKKELSWILYDCGNSAYSMAITTALLPIYFGMFKPGEGMDLGYFNSIASLIIAAISPILGTIADYKGAKKKFFNASTLLGILSTVALSFVPYSNWQLLIIFYILTCIGFAGSNIFYDAFLVDVTSDDRMDRVSSAGFAYGYISSIIPFGICLAIIYIIGMDRFLGFQISFVITALWWFVLTIPMIKNVHQAHYIEPEKHVVVNSFKRLGKTFKEIRSHKTAFIFLAAYFLYIDGVDTIIKMVVPYSQEVLNGVEFNMFLLLGILLIVQIVAFPFALIYARLAEKFGTMRTIQLGIFTYFIAVIFASTINSITHIFILAILIGSAQGGIQALSRSYFAKIIPKKNSNEFFGFYNIFGKFASILGPFIMSFITDLSGNARFSIMGILPLFFFGFLITLKLPNEAKRH